MEMNKNLKITVANLVDDDIFNQWHKFFQKCKIKFQYLSS